jgi:hypothetical protein
VLELNAGDAIIKTYLRDIQHLETWYPTRNTILIFEDTRTAVLYQNRTEAGEYTLREPVKVADLLNRFFFHQESDEREFHRAIVNSKPRGTSRPRQRRDRPDHKQPPRIPHAQLGF